MSSEQGSVYVAPPPPEIVPESITRDDQGRNEYGRTRSGQWYGRPVGSSDWVLVPGGSMEDSQRSAGAGTVVAQVKQQTKAAEFATRTATTTMAAGIILTNPELAPVILKAAAANAGRGALQDGAIALGQQMSEHGMDTEAYDMSGVFVSAATGAAESTATGGMGTKPVEIAVRGAIAICAAGLEASATVAIDQAETTPDRTGPDATDAAGEMQDNLVQDVATDSDVLKAARNLMSRVVDRVRRLF
jgi:hypothetical protein